MSLAKLLTRGAKGFPSVVTAIDRELMKDEKMFSERAVIIALNFLSEAIKNHEPPHVIQQAYQTFVDRFNAPRPRRRDVIHPSGLYYDCPRMLYYRLTDVEPANKAIRHDAKTQRTFDVGHWYHKYIQKTLMTCGLMLEDEVFVQNKDLHLQGHCDGKIQLEGVVMTGEIKTANSRSYANVVKSGRPMDAHIYQASIYARELNLDYLIFLYVNKDTSEIHEIILNKSEFQSYQDDAYEKIHGIVDAVKKGVEPARVCGSAIDDRAMKCEYCNHCFKLK